MINDVLMYQTLHVWLQKRRLRESLQIPSSKASQNCPKRGVFAAQTFELDLKFKMFQKDPKSAWYNSKILVADSAPML